MFPEQSFTPLFASAVFSNLEQSHQLRANTNMNFFSPNPVQYDNGYPYFAAPTSMKPTQVVIAEARMMSAMYENHRAATSTVTPAQMAEAFAQIASNVSPSAPIMHTAATVSNQPYFDYYGFDTSRRVTSTIRAGAAFLPSSFTYLFTAPPVLLFFTQHAHHAGTKKKFLFQCQFYFL